MKTKKVTKGKVTKNKDLRTTIGAYIAPEVMDALYAIANGQDAKPETVEAVKEDAAKAKKVVAAAKRQKKNRPTPKQTKTVKNVEKGAEVFFNSFVKKTDDVEAAQIIVEINNVLHAKYNAFRAIASLKKLGMDEEGDKIVNRLANESPANSKTRKGATISQFLKNMENVLIGSITYDVEDKTIVSDFKVQPTQESELLRQTEYHKVIFADNFMAFNDRNVSFDILSVKLERSILNEKSYMNALTKRLVNGVVIKYNKISGKCQVLKNTIMKTSNPNIDVFKYKFLGITPSGLRSGTVMLGLTDKLVNGKLTHCDKRIQLLDAAIAGGFQGNFVHTNDKGEVEFNEGDLEKIFKNMSRELLSAPASKRLFKAKNYIIVSNIAEWAQYKDENGQIIDASNTQDGASSISANKLLAFFKEQGIKASLADVEGLVSQLRGASAKDSGIARRKKDIATLMYALIKRAAKKINGSIEDAIKYLAKDMIIVHNGARYEGKEISKELIDETLKDIDFLADWNAFKLFKFDPEFHIVCLKQGHATQTGINTVINLMLQFADPDAAYRIIMSRTKDEIVKSFETIGVKVTLDENKDVTNVSVVPDLLRKINNDSQMNQFLLKNNPGFTIKLLPQILKGAIANTLKSIQNKIHVLNPRVESSYIVVQSDWAPLFGQQILKYGEFYSNDIKAPRIAGVRHPISTLFSVSIMRRVTFSEIVKRINQLPITADEKNFLYNAYKSQKGFLTLCATESLMEKHDGMDFDIDSMAAITDQEIVDVLSKIEDVTPFIDRTRDKALNISVNKSRAEIMIESKKENVYFEGTGYGEFPEETLKKSVESLKMKNPLGAKKLVGDLEENKDVLDMSFSCQGEVTKNYFLNPIAPIGIIATGFYNNAMLLSVLKDQKVDMSIKEKIAGIFSYAYECDKNSKNSYVSPLKWSTTQEGNKKIILDKESCTRVVFNYSNSRGSVMDTLAFLTDCCNANRYPGETSIDSAKKMYQIIDMFNNSMILRSLGSDKNCIVDNVIDDTKFSSIVQTLNEAYDAKMTLNNIFGITLLEMAPKGLDCESIEDCSLEYIIDTMKEQGVAISKHQLDEGAKTRFTVKDMFYNIKSELVDFTNFLAVLCSKKLQNAIFSAEAKAARNDMIATADEFIYTKEMKPFKVALNSIRYLSFTLDNAFSHSDDIDGQNAMLYKKSIAIKTLKNTAALLFRGLKKYEIGNVVLGQLAQEFKENFEKDGTIKSINKNFFNIFDEDILSYLKACGNQVTAGERIVAVIKGNKSVSDDSIIGYHISFVGGVGSAAEDDTILVYSENKNSNASGIVEMSEDGHAYVMFDRKIVERDASLGIFSQINTDVKYNIVKDMFDITYFDKVEFIPYQFNASNVVVEDGSQEIDMGTNKLTPSYNLLVGHVADDDGKDVAVPICELKMAPEMADILKDLDDLKFNIFYSKPVGGLKDQDGYDYDPFVSITSEKLTALIEDAFKKADDFEYVDSITSLDEEEVAIGDLNDDETSVLDYLKSLGNGIVAPDSKKEGISESAGVSISDSDNDFDFWNTTNDKVDKIFTNVEDEQSSDCSLEISGENDFSIFN